MKVSELLAAATKRLGGADARLEAELLLAQVLGKSRAWLYAWPEQHVEQDGQAAFERVLQARLRGEPIAYLSGHREFWSLDLVVTPDVLIPRPETELLVELALVRIPHEAQARVVDLGTGSGAIALAIAHERPLARVTASDASAAALAVARGNAERLGLRTVEFVQGDWCAALGARRFDVIVSNPPYVAAGDSHLGEGDVRFEPRSALVSGSDGLDAIRQIAGAAPRHLGASGWLLLEHGWDQASAVRELLAQQGFDGIGTARDFGGHERVTFGQWPA